MRIIPVILCGGQGARLWPLSREMCPKPFIDLPGIGNLMEMTMHRAKCVLDAEHLVIVTRDNLRELTLDAVAKAAPQFPVTCLLEPEGHDTALAIALAVRHIIKTHGPDCGILIMPSDHFIADTDRFCHAVDDALPFMIASRIVTFGITPTHPETGYGYIGLSEDQPVTFMEKPDLARAKHYIKDGRYLWNSGMFGMSAATAIAAFETYFPAILSIAEKAIDAAEVEDTPSGSVIRLRAESIASAPVISFDHAIMEHAKNIACIPLDCGWSDIGNWETVASYLPPDAQKNRIADNVFAEDSNNCFVYSNDRLVGCVGVENLLVIDTPDALLIATRDRAQDVKSLYKRLQSHRNETASQRITGGTPAPMKTFLSEFEKRCIYLLRLEPSQKLVAVNPLERALYWIILQGTAVASVNGDDTHIEERELFLLNGKGVTHLENRSNHSVIALEVAEKHR